MKRVLTVAGIAGPQKLTQSYRGKRGRSPEFQRYMAELQVTDPARWALINAEERKTVDVIETQLAADEQVITEQQEGWSDPTGQRGA